jgi:threonine dehydratase
MRQAKNVIEKTGATFIHPFNNYNVMAGQGTMAIELFNQAKQQGTPLDALIVPVGGGGMLSGIATAIRHLDPKVKVFAAEPTNVNDCSQSFSAKHHVLNPVGATSVADGLLTNIGTNTLPIILNNVDNVFTVSEEDIIRTTKLVWTFLKLCIEPSAAVGVSVALHNKEFNTICEEQNLRNIGVILCGGNVDIIKVAQLFEQ